MARSSRAMTWKELSRQPPPGKVGIGATIQPQQAFDLPPKPDTLAPDLLPCGFSCLIHY
jgi:hypothetical protein